MLEKDEIKKIEKVFSFKEVKSFLKTLDLAYEKKLSIPNLRAYVEDKQTTGR